MTFFQLEKIQVTDKSEFLLNWDEVQRRQSIINDDDRIKLIEHLITEFPEFSDKDVSYWKPTEITGMKRYFRTILYYLSLKGLLVEYLEAATDRVWYMIVYINGSLWSEFFLVHVKRLFYTVDDTVEDVGTSLLHLFVSNLFLGMALFIIYEIPRFHHYLCRRTVKQQRNRTRFRQATIQDLATNPITKDNSWDYDSDADDPDIALLFFHRNVDIEEYAHKKNDDFPRVKRKKGGDATNRSRLAKEQPLLPSMYSNGPATQRKTKVVATSNTSVDFQKNFMNFLPPPAAT